MAELEYDGIKVIFESHQGIKYLYDVDSECPQQLEHLQSDHGLCCTLPEIMVLG